MKGAGPKGGSTSGGDGETGALTRTLRDLMKPEAIREVRITHSAEGTISGFLLTNCPTEGQDHWKDFEVHLAGPGGPVDYAIVDGKRLAISTSQDVSRSGRRR